MNKQYSLVGKEVSFPVSLCCEEEGEVIKHATETGLLHIKTPEGHVYKGYEHQVSVKHQKESQ